MIVDIIFVKTSRLAKVRIDERRRSLKTWGELILN